MRIFVAGCLGATAGIALAMLLQSDDPPAPIPGPIARNKTPVIPLISHQITIPHATQITEVLEKYSDRPIILLLHTLGGGLLPVVQLARAIRRHGQVTALIPHRALSGGTLVALAAQQILLRPHANLGPVDPQIAGFSASSLLWILDHKPVQVIDDITLTLAHEARKALEQIEAITREYIGDNPAALHRLVAGITPHSYPITLEEAQQLGLNVRVTDPHREFDALVDNLIRQLEAPA